MKRILIIYKVFQDLEQDYLQKIINGCKSKNHKVTINFHDFTLSKKIRSQIDKVEFSELEAINISDENYEDMENSDQIIVQNLIPYSDFDIVSILVHDISLDGSIDEIDFTPLEDDLIGSIYTDNYITKPFKSRMYCKSHPLMNTGIRCVFVNMSKLISAIGQDNPVGHVYSQHGSCHIPKALFTTY